MTAAVARAAFFKTVLRVALDSIEAFLPNVDNELFLFCVNGIPKTNGRLAEAMTFRAAQLLGSLVRRRWRRDVAFAAPLKSLNKIRRL